MSHPVWVRGLKPKAGNQKQLDDIVAPRVGAWIETDRCYERNQERSSSHPVWVRGLKQ